MKSLFKKLLTSIAVMSFAVIALSTVDVQAAVTHTVCFSYGTKNNVQIVEDGKNAVIPTDTNLPGFKFMGWTDSAMNVKTDKVIIGIYTADISNAATVQLAAQQSLAATQANQTQQALAAQAILTQQALSNAPTVPLVSPSPSASVKRVNCDKSAPALPWWDMSLKGVPGKTCVLRWYNGSTGELWKTEVVPYGTTLPNPADPCLDGYEFIGWIGSWEVITEDRNIEACYLRDIRHKVYWVDSVTDNVYHMELVSDHGNATPIDWAPNHESAEDGCFGFTGQFEGNLNDVTEERFIYALYHDFKGTNYDENIPSRNGEDDKKKAEEKEEKRREKEKEARKKAEEKWKKEMRKYRTN